MLYMDEEEVKENLSDDVPNLLANDWSIQTVWNEVLSMANERELKPRREIWASEIGRDYYERYLKMQGVPPPLSYPNRVQRIFAAGDFFERIVGYIFIVSGLLKADNEKKVIKGETDTLDVGVRPDYVAGGLPDWQKVKQEIETNPMFNFMPKVKTIAERLVSQLREKYPNGLRNLVYEIKSINSQVFWSKKDYLKEAYPHHVLQLYTGMKAYGFQEGRLLYVSKDDLTVAEFPIFASEELEDRWQQDVKEMSSYILASEPPPKPENVVFDSRKKLTFQKNKEKQVIKGCWTPNWQIQRSLYLPLITGFEDGDVWEKSLKEEIKQRNEALKQEHIAKL